MSKKIYLKWVAKIQMHTPKGNAIRGTGVLVLGNAVAQTLVFLVSPLLTRLYSPHEFGILAIFVSTINIIGTMVCGSYEVAVALPETRKETKSVVIAAILVATLVAPISSLGFLATPWALIIVTEGYTPLFVFLATAGGSALIGVCAVYRYWGIKQERYIVIARSRVIQTVARIVTQCGLFVGGATTLILGTVFAYFIGFFCLQRDVHDPCKPLRKDVYSVMSRYRRFPLYMTWSSALNMTGKQMPTFAFVTLFGAGPAGLYSLAERIIAGPVSMVTSAVSAVLLNESVKSKRNGNLALLVRETHDVLSHISIPPFLILACTAPAVFGILFGEEWSDTGIIASWISLYLCLSFISAPLTVLFRTLEMQDIELKIQITLFITRLIAIFWGAKVGGFIFSVACYSIVSALYYIYIMVWASRSVKLEIAIIFKQTALACFWAVLTVSPNILVYFYSPSITEVLAATLASVVLVTTRFLIYVRYLNGYRRTLSNSNCD